MSTTSHHATESGHAETGAQDMVGGYTRSFGLSFAITSVISSLLVILKETNEDTVLAWMKAATGHHWVTHGIFDILLFVILGFALAKSGDGREMSADSLITTVVGALVLSVLIIVGFYI